MILQSNAFSISIIAACITGSCFLSCNTAATNNSIDSGFIFPAEGDVIHKQDLLTPTDNTATITVRYAAPEGSNISINHSKASYTNGQYEANIVIDEGKNLIIAKNEKTDSQDTVLIHFAPVFAGGYRLSVDDNIWFLKDLTANKNKYKSLFDNPFLAVYKRLHDKYGTKVHFNLFYETDGFNLSQMTDQYKEEWKQNSDWIQLSFHANQEFPDRPYLDAGYDKVTQDCQKLLAEVKRFAGAELIAPVTTLHWGAANINGSRALRDIGYTTQVGYFNVDDALEPVAYYLDKDQIRRLKKRYIWRDNKENITFVRACIVVDTKKVEDIVPHIEAQGNIPFVELLVHEQYFYDHYKNYQPDYESKLITAVEWAHNKGFKPTFLNKVQH